MPLRGDTAVAQDAALRLTFDRPIDPASASRAVALLDAETGEVLSLPVIVEEERPNQVALRPRGRQMLAPHRWYRLVVAPDTLIAQGLRGLDGARLASSIELRFRTGEGFRGFHALEVDPADGDDRWISSDPTEITIRFSGPVDRGMLRETLRRLDPGRGLLEDAAEGRPVPVRVLVNKSDDSPEVLRLTTLTPLPAGRYRIHLAGFREAETGRLCTSWNALFTLRRTRELRQSPAPIYFTAAGAPENLARRPDVTVSGELLHAGERAIDGITEAERGEPAWLSTSLEGDFSEPQLVLSWAEPVTIAELIVDTENSTRMLSSYRVQAFFGTPGLPIEAGRIEEVAVQRGALGDHVLVIDPPVTTERLSISHARTLFGSLGLLTPVLYELGVHGEAGYSSRAPRNPRMELFFDAGGELVVFGNPRYRCRTGLTRDASDCGCRVFFRTSADPPDPNVRPADVQWDRGGPKGEILPIPARQLAVIIRPTVDDPGILDLNYILVDATKQDE